MTQLQNTADQFFTGTGILLQGDPFRANTTGFNNVPLKDGRVEYYCAVGFPKDQPAATNFNALWAIMQQVAATHPYAGSYQASAWAGFHWKMEDGDAPANANKPGWKGCYVIKFKNGYAPAVFDENRQIVPSPYVDTVGADGKITQSQKPGAHPFPCGHFVRVMCNVVPNKAAPPQSGLHINFSMIQRVGYGTVIHSGPDYSQIMQQEHAALPGMSTMPVGGATPGLASPGLPGPVGGPALPGAVGIQGPAVGVGAALPGVAGLPGGPGLPGALPGQTLPPSAGMGGLPAGPGGLPAGPAALAPVVETPQQRMLVNDFPFEKYLEAGYTEEILVQQGKMRPAAAAAAAAGPTGLPPGPGQLPPVHAYNQ